MNRNIKDFSKRRIHFPDTKSRWAIIVFITLWVFFILYSLHPFGINFAKNKFSIIALNTIGVFSVCVICIQVLPLVFKKYYTAESWTNAKFLEICFIAITAFAILDTFVLSIYIDNREGFPYYAYSPLHKRFFIFYMASLLVSAFPISIIYYLLYIKNKKDEEHEIWAQNAVHIMTANSEVEDGNTREIELSGKTKDHIRLVPEDILYVKASGNYVDIYYLKEEEKVHKLLRISMNTLSDSLCDFPYIIRCHRAFMVNIKKIEKIQGNLKGYQMKLKNTETKIPVSKSYTKAVKEKIVEVSLPSPK